MKLWLVGMMGVGKTTVGHEIATRLSMKLIDLDQDIETEQGMTVAEIFELKGEVEFRRMEREALLGAAWGPTAVVATGGGAILDQRNRIAMRNTGKVVWLAASTATLSMRIDPRLGRPLLARAPIPARLEQIWAERQDLYRAASDMAIRTDDLEVSELAERIEGHWKRS